MQAVDGRSTGHGPRRKQTSLPRLAQRMSDLLLSVASVNIADNVGFPVAAVVEGVVVE